jgi:hypothetical protein
MYHRIEKVAHTSTLTVLIGRNGWTDKLGGSGEGKRQTSVMILAACVSWHEDATSSQKELVR